MNLFTFLCNCNYNRRLRVELTPHPGQKHVSYKPISRNYGETQLTQVITTGGKYGMHGMHSSFVHLHNWNSSWSEKFTVANYFSNLLLTTHSVQVLQLIHYVEKIILRSFFKSWFLFHQMDERFHSLSMYLLGYHLPDWESLTYTTASTNRRQ